MQEKYQIGSKFKNVTLIFYFEDKMNIYDRKKTKTCRYLSLILIFLSLGITYCQRISLQVPPYLKNVVKNVKKNYAPDSRIELFDIHLEKKGDQVIISGELTNSQHKKILLDSLQAVSQYYDFLDNITVLPSKELQSQNFGIVYVSVANQRKNPKHSAELVNQTLLGTVLKLYKKEGGFYFSRNKDQYLGWVSGASMIEIDSSAASEWENAPHVVCSANYAVVFENPDPASNVVVDLVPGAKLKKLSLAGKWFNVETPDGRRGYVESKLVINEDNYLQIVTQKSRLIKTAKNFLGIPYLWGGTSAKGFDCSGFVQTVFSMNNSALPRDTNQMVKLGKVIDLSDGLTTLLPGDLLFFGPNEKIMTNVAIYIGDKQFIHSSGWVHINSLDPQHQLYNECRHKNLRTARRILDE